MDEMVKEENQNFHEIPQQEQQVVMEDQSSSSSSSSSGPLFHLSELMAHLPIKRGLSKHYEGKSQSFKSFGSLKGLEDLAKKDKKKRIWSPRPIITKKASSRSMVSLVRNHRLATCNRPTIPIQK